MDCGGHTWVGRLSPKEPGDTDAVHREKCITRSTAYFKDVTQDLRSYGGLVLFVQKAGRMNQQIVRHLEAVNRVLYYSLPTTSIRVLTYVPQKYLYLETEKDEGLKKQRTDDYFGWLQAMQEGLQVIIQQPSSL
jgi:hypothetical protein